MDFAYASTHRLRRLELRCFSDLQLALAVSAGQRYATAAARIASVAVVRYGARVRRVRLLDNLSGPHRRD